MQERAENKERIFSSTEFELLENARKRLYEADQLVVRLGGKAGRLGECVVGTGLLETTLQALHALKREGVALHIVVDESVAELFDAQLYRERYWPQITIEYAAHTTHLTLETLAKSGQQVLALDFHGGHDDMPYLEQSADVAMLGHLFRTGIRNYAIRGSERRYADFVEDLFALPTGTIGGQQAQPRLYLSPDNERRYHELVKALGLDIHAVQVVCFFQSVVLAKCYERWDDAMQMLCEEMARRRPEEHIDFLVACGPEADLPDGFKCSDMEDWFRDFEGYKGNAHVRTATIPSLRDLATLIKHARLVLANDTGPGHIAGALGAPTVTPYLPGNLYSQRVWSSTLWHHGVTLEPSPYSFEQLKNAVLWGKTDIINSIAPKQLFEEMRACLF